MMEPFRHMRIFARRPSSEGDVAASRAYRDGMLDDDLATPTPTLEMVVAAMARLYPPSLQASWDAVGLVCGDPQHAVRRIMVAVDPTEQVVAEALGWDADLLICHHPRLLSGVHGVPTTTAAGRVVHQLIQGSCALLSAHTNADAARPGVSDALAAALGVGDLTVLEGSPETSGRRLLTSDEEPASEVIDIVDDSRRTGIGRVGMLAEPVTLSAFAEVVAARLPATAAGVRVAGDPNQLVQRVAVCGGAGDSLLGDANAAGADVYVTADLRHHRALDHIAEGGCALIDVAHWASEWPWCPQVAELLGQALDAELLGAADSVEIHVSQLPTDPWTAHLRSHA